VRTPPQERVLPLALLAGGSREDSGTVSEPDSLDDHDLMVRLEKREPKALEILFDRYSRLVRGIAIRTLKDYGEAEDALQDTFLYVYRRAALFDPRKGSFKAWIIQVAFHRALDRKSRLSRGGYYPGTEIYAVDDTLPGTTDLDREIGSRLDRVKLKRAFAEIPEAQRHTLEMFYFEGLELREIAEKRNETLGNVRHHYYRGLEQLRKSAFVGRFRKVRVR
jgi:RNA polymerase sigma-70 factor (ECF subfamily)